MKFSPSILGVFPLFLGWHPVETIQLFVKFDITPIFPQQFSLAKVLLLMAEILHHLECMKPYK